jgi:N,N-dimethylformamidase
VRIVGYTDPLTVAPGDRVSVMVSTTEPDYQAGLVRLVHGALDPAGPGFRAEPVKAAFAGRHPGRVQRLRLGSWLELPDHPALEALADFTLLLWVQPTAPGGGEQAIAARDGGDGPGWLLALDARGCPFLAIDGPGGGARLATDTPLRRGAWVLLALGYDRAVGAAWLQVAPREPWPERGGRIAAPAPAGLWRSRVPLRIAAQAGADGMAAHFNGKVGGIRLLGRSLDAALVERWRDGAEAGPEPVAAWHLGLAVEGDRAIDRGPHQIHGRVHSQPMRGVTGPRWRGRSTAPREAPDEYDAIHFHDDDLEDAGWAEDFAWTVPAGLQSGIYAVRLAAAGAEDYLPLFVVPGPGQQRAPVAFLAPVYSYLAYANEHYMADPARQSAFGFDLGKALAGATGYERAVFAYACDNRLHSLYDAHSDGTGVCYASRRRPLATMRPRYNKASLWFRAPHQLNEDLCLVDWLVAQGHRHDVLTDELLHRDGADALRPYRVVVTGSHPEYWTGPMLDGLAAYLAEGGRVMYLGGNGFYWVTSVDPARPHLIEVRRHSGTRIWQAAPGEYHHSTTGEPGGPWRFRGRPPQQLVGVGFTAQGNDRSSPYRRLPGSRDPRASFIFEGVEAEVFGGCGLQLGGAGGYEIDRADPALGTPPHCLRLAETFGHSDSYQHAIEETLETDALQGGTVNPLVRADMVFFEGPQGGAVFSVGSISWCAALSANGYDNDVSRITGNVLRRFCRDEPFALDGGRPAMEEA